MWRDMVSRSGELGGGGEKDRNEKAKPPIRRTNRNPMVRGFFVPIRAIRGRSPLEKSPNEANFRRNFKPCRTMSRLESHRGGEPVMAASCTAMHEFARSAKSGKM